MFFDSHLIQAGADLLRQLFAFKRIANKKVDHA
jgi:hypothetical protein